jgi:arylsulfatase A-like enzyme
MRKNVIIILGDCVGADYLYDDNSLYIPTVNQLGAKGVVFRNVITSTPWTNPSLSSLFTGIYSHKLDLYKYKAGFPGDVKLIQEYFKDQDYNVASFFGTKNLFSESRVYEEGTTRDIPKILDWIGKNSDNSFSLFLHYWQTHIPYFYRYSKKGWYEGKDSIMELLQTKDGRQKVKDLYKHSIERFSEEFIYSIIEKLIDLNIFDNTHLIITADHGDSFGERDVEVRELDLFSMHGKSLYQETLRIPLMCVGPGVPSGKEIRSQVRNIDTVPTLLELHAIEEDINFRRIDGKSLVDLWSGKEEGNRLAFSSTTYGYWPSDEEPSQAFSLYAALDGDWKVIYDRRENQWVGYNLNKDPKENNPLQIENHKSLKELKEQLAKEIPEKEIAEEERKVLKKRLQDLGYL